MGTKLAIVFLIGGGQLGKIQQERGNWPDGISGDSCRKNLAHKRNYSGGLLLARGAIRRAPKGQPARSPGQSEAAPWVMNTQQRFRPARAKAYIIGSMYGRIINAGSYAFALAGRKQGTDDNTQGVASLCPGLRAGCPFGARRIAPLASNKPPE